MKLLNNLIEVEQMVIYPSNSDLFQAVATIVADAEVDLGDFAEQFEMIAEKIEEDTAAQEEPIELSEEDQNYLYGLALICGVKL